MDMQAKKCLFMQLTALLNDADSCLNSFISHFIDKLSTFIKFQLMTSSCLQITKG